MDLGLAGRHCFVTGASSGIGRGTALALAAEGALLSIAGRDEDALAATRDMVVAHGGSVFRIVASDLSQPAGIEAAAAAIKQAERPVEVLVNNAGGGRPYSLDAPLDAEAWDEATGLNFTAARRLAESALPAMRRAHWGRIITITGSLALKRMNAATPAKAAITSWSRALSIQVAADGITVNCVAPGRINSAQTLNRLFPTEEARRREIELNVPAGRFGEPEEIAAAIAFLASAPASYVTGTMIPVTVDSCGSISSSPVPGEASAGLSRRLILHRFRCRHGPPRRSVHAFPLSVAASSGTRMLNVTNGSTIPQARTYRWVVLAVATIAQASACFLVQGLGALAIYMQNALSLNALQIGLLVSATQLVPVLGLLVAGELLDRFSERLIVGLGAFVVGAALASASFAASYQALLLWLVVVGAGYSTAQPGGSKSVLAWFSKSQRGFAIGVRQAGLPLGGALAAATIPFVATAYSWRAAFLVGAGAAFAGGALFIAVYRSPTTASIRDNDNKPSFKSILSERFSMLYHPSMRDIIFSGVTLVTVQYSILMFISLFLKEKSGLSSVQGAQLLFVALISGVFGRIILAAWSDVCKYGRYFPILVSMLSLIAGLLLLVVFWSTSFIYLSVLMAWFGFFGFGWYGPWVTYIAEAAPPDRVGFALGLAMAINQVAIVGSPPLLGFLRDRSGTYITGWVGLIVMLLFAVMMTRHPSVKASAV